MSAPSGTGSRASHEADKSSSPKASIPSAAEIAMVIEAAQEGCADIDKIINDFLRPPRPHDPTEKGPPPGFGDEPFLHLGYWGTPYTQSLDVALTLLEPPNDWRRLTPKSMSVYAASPYNAAAQVRYDGYGATPALQLCAAAFKMRAALEAKASAIEARRAATTGAVHESAVPQGDAQ